MKQVKIFLSILLCLSMLLTLCGCGKKEKDEKRPKLDISGSTQVKEKNDAENAERPKLDIGGTTQDKGENNAEQTSTPVTLLDNEYFTLVQGESTDYGFKEFNLVVTNKTDGTLNVICGERYYVNDLKLLDTGFSPYSEIGAGETKTVLYGLAHFDQGTMNKVDCSIKVSYNNNLAGVYAESFEVFNELINIYTSGDSVPEKYVSTEKEMDVIETGDFKMIATKEGIDNSDDHYRMQLYFENKSDDYITFYVADPVTMTSDLQENVGCLARSGFDTTGEGVKCTIDPGKGCYLPVWFGKTGKSTNMRLTLMKSLQFTSRFV